ncbi:MAG: hypothetical protein JHC39_04360 [Lentimicrobium sp.]|jgi:hypothetical protein|nr:hypothetical protein [Lentimicrobium sp.]
MKNKFLKIILPMLLLIVATFVIGPGCDSPTLTSPPASTIVEKAIVVDAATGDPFPEITDKDCVGNYITNGYFNTTVQSPDIQVDEDIIAATGWRRVWKKNPPFNVIGADLFSSGTSAMGTPPTPASGNYASMWVTNNSTDPIQYREAMFNRLHHFIKPEPVPVTYVLGFKTAKLNNTSQQVEISIYGVNYDDISPAILPLQPTTIVTPTNINLFGAANTVLLGTVMIPVGANNTWVNQNIAFTPNSKEYPVAGFNYILITRSDNEGKGMAYCAFDDFCLHKK